MESDVFRESEHSRPAPFPLLYCIARVLAVVDAVALQTLLLYWVWTWRGHHGGLVGGVVATLLVWWALKRGARAVFAFDSYRWLSRHLVKLIAVGLILQGVMLVQRMF